MMIGPVAVELRRPPGESLRSTTSNATVGRKARRTLEAFVVGEVALATMLLMGAVLLLTSLYRLEHRDRGYTAQGVMTASVFLKGDNLGTPARQAAVAQAMIAALKNTPGIRDAAVASAAPLLTSSSSEVSRSSSGTGQSMQVWSVSDDYFQTLHVPLRFGHLFGSAEASVVVIDSGAAIRLFGTTAALGQRLYIGTARIPATIVGLVGSIDDLRNGIRTGAVIRSIGPHIYTPFRERPGRRLTLLVRSSLGEADASNTIRLIIGSVAPGTPILSVQSMTSIEQQEFARERFTSFLAAGSAILGLVIALVGLYALMNAVVAQHSRSYVLRLVLGAPRWTVLRAATQRVMVLGGLGVTVGLCLGGFNARVLASVLFETRAGDPRLYAFVVAAVMLTLTAAALWPTRRLLKQELTAVLR
jgi:putative ABC transport system permease protein